MLAKPAAQCNSEWQPKGFKQARCGKNSCFDCICYESGIRLLPLVYHMQMSLKVGVALLFLHAQNKSSIWSTRMGQPVFSFVFPRLLLLSIPLSLKEERVLGVTPWLLCVTLIWIRQAVLAPTPFPVILPCKDHVSLLEREILTDDHL